MGAKATIGTDLAAFREAVFDDFHLALRLRPIRDREVFIEQAIAIAASTGFVVDEAALRVEMRRGQDTWIDQDIWIHQDIWIDQADRYASGSKSSPPGASTTDRLFGWTPFRIGRHDAITSVDWCHLDARRMTAPFFYETILHAMREPFNLVFQQRTPIEALAELPPGLPIAGFVFHMSRCGSTLVSQALAAFESNIVVSEAAPLRSVLRAAAAGLAPPETAARWLAGLVNAYAQPRFSYEARLFVKFMAADALDIALVRRAFPDVPWIFVTRDPAEILASQARAAGIDLVRGQIAPGALGLAADAVWSMDANAYRAHVLASFARAARDAWPSGGGLILDYAELPDALLTKVLPHFGLHADAGAIEVLRTVCARHSKAPDTPFVGAQDPNRAGAAPFRPIAEEITGEVMAALAALRGQAR